MKSRRKFLMVRNQWCSINRKTACTCRKRFCRHFSAKLFVNRFLPFIFLIAATRANIKPKERGALENACTKAEKSRSCLFRRARYLHHYSVAKGKLRLRSDRHDWRRRPTGRFGSRTEKSTGHGSFDRIRPGPARGIHSRF